MASQNGRRKFLATLGAAAAAWPLTLRAQQSLKPFRIGYLSATSAPDPWIFSGRGWVLSAISKIVTSSSRLVAHRDYGRFPNLVEELLNAFQDLERLPAGLDGPRRPL